MGVWVSTSCESIFHAQGFLENEHTHYASLSEKKKNSLTILNGVTGLNEMKTIPPIGPNQFAEYGRSQRKYLELKKKIKLCQNRGGE